MPKEAQSTIECIDTNLLLRIINKIWGFHNHQNLEK